VLYIQYNAVTCKSLHTLDKVKPRILRPTSMCFDGVLALVSMSHGGHRFSLVWGGCRSWYLQKWLWNIMSNKHTKFLYIWSSNSSPNGKKKTKDEAKLGKMQRDWRWKALMTCYQSLSHSGNTVKTFSKNYQPTGCAQKKFCCWSLLSWKHENVA